MTVQIVLQRQMYANYDVVLGCALESHSECFVQMLLTISAL